MSDPQTDITSLKELIFERSSTGMVLIDAKHKIVLTNKRFKDAMKISDPETMDFRDLLAESDQPSYIEFIKKAGADPDKTLDLELTFSSNDHKLNFTGRLSSIENQNLFLLELDDRSRSGKPLEGASTELKFKAVFNGSFDLILLLDPIGKIVEANATAKQYMDGQQEELEGKFIWDVPLISKNIIKVMRFKSAIRLSRTGSLVRDQFEFSNDSGKWHFDISFQPILNSKNRITNIIVEARDITKLVKVQNALAQNEEFYSSIIRNTPGYKVLIFDKDLSITFAEGPALLESKLSKEDIEGRSIEVLVEGEDARQRLSDEMKKVFEGDEVSFEQELGEKAYYFNSFPMRDDRGEIKAGVVIVQNISEIKAAQHSLNDTITQLDAKNEELKAYIESNLELEQFAYIASHDLREPLRTINGFASILYRKYYDQLDNKAQSYLEFMNDATSRMDNLINDLLIYSRIGTDKALFEVMDTRELFTQAIESLGKAISESDAKIHLGILPDKIIGYRTKLLQLVTNLISNAIKYRRDGVAPAIRVESRSVGNYWEFSIEDNGIGIEKEYYDKIFLLFKRLHDHQTFSGTGLGLSICKRIVDQHRGRIWVESEYGSGSTFYFTLKKNLTN